MKSQDSSRTNSVFVGVTVLLPPPPPQVPPTALPPLPCPVTLQMMKSGVGKAGAGVQVSVLLSVLQVGVVVSVLPLVSSNIAVVKVVFIAPLNVKTTAALAETPVAPVVGTTETMVGPAAAIWARKLIVPTTASNPAVREARTKRGNKFKIISVTCLI